MELLDQIKHALIIGCIVVLLGALMLFCVLPFFAGLTLLSTYEGAVSKFDGEFEINEFIASIAGVNTGKGYRLRPEDEEKISELGFDMEVVANSVAAINWIRDDFETEIDIGMMLAIFTYESGSGKNLGSCSGIPAARSNPNVNPDQEEAAARWLLNHWKENQTHLSPLARDYIYSDFSGYTGHCAAGEMGFDGILPTTGLKICRDGLSTHSDNEVNSCDFWSQKVSSFAKAWWLHAIDYDAGLTREQKISELYGWNHLLSYRIALVDKAEEINSVLGSDLLVEDFYLYDGSVSGIFETIASFLDNFGLLPEGVYFGKDQKWLSVPLRPENNHGITQNWGDTFVVSPPAPFHQGVDWKCYVGDPVLAIADGVVVEPALASWKYDPFGWGNIIWLDHGGIYSAYAHLSEKKVDFGQKIKKGGVIGLCGSTGYSTGSHLHFATADIPPDDFPNWYAMEPGWTNPHDYLGKLVKAKNKK
jgi:murein DD-endopeptidase MepM/ murein hydrolase activator NlpD